MISFDFGFNGSFLIPRIATLISAGVLLFFLTYTAIRYLFIRKNWQERKIKIQLRVLKIIRRFRTIWYFSLLTILAIFSIIKRSDAMVFVPFNGYALIFSILMALTLLPFIKKFDILGVGGELEDLFNAEQAEKDAKKLEEITSDLPEPTDVKPEVLDEQKVLLAKQEQLKREKGVGK